MSEDLPSTECSETRPGGSPPGMHDGQHEETFRDTERRLRNANHQLRIRLLAFISRYDRDHPMRTADVHDPDCGCLRCERDRAATLLAKG